jgi:hypothetical protein
MFRALAGQQGWARTVRQDGSVGLRWLDRSGPAQAETAIVYDQATELPISVEVFSGGTLRQRITYERGP